MRYKLYASLFSILLFINCAGSNNAFKDLEVVLRKHSLEKYGIAFSIIYNSDKSYSIVVKQEKSTAKNPNPILQFFVYEMGKDKIIFEDSVPAGRIKWKSNNQIEVTVTPEMVSTEDNVNLYGYIYNVDIRTKTGLNSKSIKQNQ